MRINQSGSRRSQVVLFELKHKPVHCVENILGRRTVCAHVGLIARSMIDIA